MGENAKIREIRFYGSYFQDFFERLSFKAKSKVIWTLRLVEELPRIPETYLKHLESTHGLYEIRVQTSGIAIRLCCFFDQRQIIIVTHGFIKKTQKTPHREIEKAIEIKRRYEIEKKINRIP